MIRSEVRERVAIVTIDNPPVNALPVAGWFQLADALARGRSRSRRARRDPPRRGQGLPGRRRHQGARRRPDRTQSLIGVNRGCYEAFAAVYDCEVPGHRRGAGLLPRRRHRARRQRRHRRRVRRRHVRRPRGRPGRARHRDAPRPLRAAAQAARDVLHGRDDHRRRAARVRHGRTGRAARAAPRHGARARGDDRREEPDRDPAGQGVAERDRAGRREALLPVRAGLHVRAQPLRRLATSCARRSSTSATPRSPIAAPAPEVTRERAQSDPRAVRA